MPNLTHRTEQSVIRSIRPAQLVAVVLPIVLVVVTPTLARAQDSTRAAPDSGQRTQPAPVPASSAAVPTAKTPNLDFSGVVFGNYQYHTDPASKDQNRFDVERAYLTFRMPAGDRASIRVTGDLFQQTASGSDAYYKGWVFRAKYAYLQYDYVKAATPAGWNAAARIGLVHTMFIDHEENFWPRWLSTTPVERAGFFSSADAGAATVVSFPQKLGEAYVAVTNGPGYASRETDRFKDYQARVTVTPLGASDLGYLRTLAVDGWMYRGVIASRFVNGGTGQIGPVSSGLDRNRWGLFAGIRDPRLTIGADYARRQDGGETGANTAASPRAVVDSTGRLTSAYVVAKPFRMIDAKNGMPLGVVLRYDRVTPNTSATDLAYHVFIGGLTWDLSSRTSLSLDYQEQIPTRATVIAAQKVWYMHWVANF